VIMVNIRVISLNCHGYNIGVEAYLAKLSTDADVILLQETWLNDCTSYKLQNMSKDFVFYHTSAMEDKIHNNILFGRPFGGTAVLVHKKFAAHCSRVITHNPRITSVCLKNIDDFDIIISSVYMPWWDRSIDHTIEYEATVGDLQSIVDRHIGCCFVFGGDLNVSKNSNNPCVEYVSNFCLANNLLWLSSGERDTDYTYHNETNSHYSLIDYFLSSPTLSPAQQRSACILQDGDNPSDHLAISWTFTVHACSGVGKNTADKRVRLNWDMGDTNSYKWHLTNHLSAINLPVDALTCNGICDNRSHCMELEEYYSSLVSCMHLAAKSSIPTVKLGFQKHWWTPELDELKHQCIAATDLWKAAGRPRSGDVNSNRVRIKLRYKNAIKDAALNADTVFNDALYDKLCKKDTVGFWKSWRKHFCMNNLRPTCFLNGKYGENNVRYEFTEHYRRVYSPNNSYIEASYKATLDKEISSAHEESALPFVDLACLESCVKRLKRNKATGRDGVMNEHIIFGEQVLYVHLSLLFNSMLKHSYVPDEFCYGMIIPLLKNKHGDVTTSDMYRGITLTSTVSKLFEMVLIELFGNDLQSDNLQYGFKKDSGCTDALFTFNETVRYFTSRGSRVFCVSLDANKAFDRVLHSGLLLKLVQKGVSLSFVKLLRDWYSRQTCAVLWNSVLGESFRILCGVRQGGVLSPVLFSLYIDDIIVKLRNSGYGLHIGSTFIGCILYADDIVLLSCSCYGLQKLVNICMNYGKIWDISFNPNKTQCITFGGKHPSRFVVMLDNIKIEWSNKLKYLGCFFNSNSCKIDFNNSVRKYYGCFNNILSVLGKGKNEMIALHLVKCYSVPMLTYSCQIWNLSLSEYKTLNVIWNNTFRKIFNCCWKESTASLQFYCNCLSMSHMIDQQSILFYKRIMRSSNVILRTLFRFKQGDICALLAKYRIPSLSLPVHVLKNYIWNHCVSKAVDAGHLTF